MCSPSFSTVCTRYVGAPPNLSPHVRTKTVGHAKKIKLAVGCALAEFTSRVGWW